MNYLILVFSLALLVKGVDILVRSASKMAKILGVPAFIVGLSIVAFGTSAPEAAIGFFSGLKGANQISLGDVIGSSIANITLILGLTAVFYPLRVDPVISRREIPLSFLVQAILAGMIYTGIFLSRFESIILLTGFVLFIAYTGIKAREIIKGQKPCDEAERELFDLFKSEKVIADEAADGKCEPGAAAEVKEKEGMARLVVPFLVGLSALILGGNFVVSSGVAIAHSLGLSEEFIGLTVIAFGTSLPELVTCLVAAFRKEEEIAVGNIIGSNILNILFVLGLSGSLSPIVASPEIFTDLGMMLLATVLLFVPSFFYQNISRLSGIIFVSSYVLFLVFKISGLR
jgi:cation:H+ antiporter